MPSIGFASGAASSCSIATFALNVVVSRLFIVVIIFIGGFCVFPSESNDDDSPRDMDGDMDMERRAPPGELDIVRLPLRLTREGRDVGVRVGVPAVIGDIRPVLRPDPLLSESLSTNFTVVGESMFRRRSARSCRAPVVRCSSCSAMAVLRAN